jgi:hypothetical protein
MRVLVLVWAVAATILVWARPVVVQVEHCRPETPIVVPVLPPCMMGDECRWHLGDDGKVSWVSSGDRSWMEDWVCPDYCIRENDKVFEEAVAVVVGYLTEVGVPVPPGLDVIGGGVEVQHDSE